MITIKYENEPTTTTDIAKSSYFTGRINGVKSQYCKSGCGKIIDLTTGAVIDGVNLVEGYKPVMVSTVDIVRSNKVMVKDIPAGTSFIGGFGSFSGIFLKLNDGGLILLTYNDDILTWGEDCKDEIIDYYEVVDFKLRG